MKSIHNVHVYMVLGFIGMHTKYRSVVQNTTAIIRINNLRNRLQIVKTVIARVKTILFSAIASFNT